MFEKEIKFVTNNRHAYDHFKIEPMSRNIPKWYKNIPRDMSNYTKNTSKTVDELVRDNGYTQTIKACVPFKDFVTSGYVIKANESVRMEQFLMPGENVTDIRYYSTNKNSISFHSFGQLPIEIDGINRTYIKFMNPWKIITPPGYSCIIYQPPLNDRLQRLFFLPAIVDTDTYDATVNFPGFLLDLDKPVDIEAGEPLIAILPFKREAWKSTMEYYETDVSKSVVNKLFRNGYKKLFWKKKTFK